MRPFQRQNNQANRHNIRRFIPRRFIRAAVREETAGGVVFRRTPKGVIELLLIQDAKDRWTIPKGHIEEGESLEIAAAREVAEETGLKHMKVLQYLGKTDFRYRREDKLILMTQHMFLIAAGKESDNIVKEDWMNGIGWFPAAEALELIEYEAIHKFFLIALKKIRNVR